MSAVDEVGNRLGVLASYAAQTRYMVNATKEEYLLPVEAINDAGDVVAALNGSPLAGLRELDATVLAAVGRFAIVWRAQEENIDHLLELPWPDLVLKDRSWQALREAAQLCLAEIGFELASWEREQGYAT